jgi:hypothetical protein
MRLALAVFCFSAPLLAQRLDDEEAVALIEKARRYALSYTASLPDFLATQVVHRFHDPRNNERWVRLDELTVRLSYSGGAEDYKLTQIDGKPTTTDFMSVGGPTSKGEFGTLLLYLFHPKMEAEFRFKGWTTVHKRRAAVYNYKVDQAHTQYHVTYGSMAEGPNHIVAPYYGEVAVPPESGEILRVTQRAILPAGFPIRQSATVVEYSYADVGGRKYLLPVHAEVTMSTSRYKSRNDVDFKEYRKFQTETTITFDR